MEIIRNNGKVKKKIIEVKRNTRRVQKKRKSIDEKIKKTKKQKARDEHFENSIKNNETKMNDYNSYLRCK